MTHPLPRTGFNSPRFIRLLADLAPDSATDAASGEHSKLSKQSFAERLAQWLDLTSAIALSGALNARVASTPAASSRGEGELEGQLALVRNALAESITTDGILRPGKVRIKLPAPTAAADFAPYRRYYIAHQRDMEASIGPLRASVRVALAARSPALRQLAELDAVLDKVVSERERSLLGTVPQLIEKRFEQLRDAHRRSIEEAQQQDDPALWMLSGGWLARFCQDMQGLLLAELQVRLQPVTGMIEAFSNERQGETAGTAVPLTLPEKATATPGGALFS